MIGWARWMLAIYAVLLSASAVALSIILALFAGMIVAELQGGSGGAAVVRSLAGAGMLGFIGVFVWWAVRWLRLALVLEDDAVTVRGLLRTVRVPWRDVSRIESARGGYWRRATQVLTHDGQRHTAIGTSYQYLLFRGEPFDEQASDPQIPLRPTQAAMAAHQRWLRKHSSPARDDPG